MRNYYTTDMVNWNENKKITISPEDKAILSDPNNKDFEATRAALLALKVEYIGVDTELTGILAEKFGEMNVDSKGYDFKFLYSSIVDDEGKTSGLINYQLKNELHQFRW